MSGFYFVLFCLFMFCYDFYFVFLFPYSVFIGIFFKLLFKMDIYETNKQNSKLRRKNAVNAT